MDGCRRWWSWWGKKLSIQTTYLSVFSLMVPGENGEWNLFCSLTFFNAGEKMFLLCNYFIFLLIFFISCCWFSMEVCRSSFFFFWSQERIGFRCGRSPPVLSLFFTTPLLWFSLSFGRRVTWREEMDLIPWAFPLVLLSLVYRINREKISRGGGN